MPPGIGKLNRRTKGGPHCRRGREPAKKRPCGKSGRLPPGIASIVAEDDQRFGIAGGGGGFDQSAPLGFVLLHAGSGQVADAELADGVELSDRRRRLEPEHRTGGIRLHADSLQVAAAERILAVGIPGPRRNAVELRGPHRLRVASDAELGAAAELHGRRQITGVERLAVKRQRFGNRLRHLIAVQIVIAQPHLRPCAAGLRRLPDKPEGADAQAKRRRRRRGGSRKPAGESQPQKSE